jgi:predicted RNA binding protein YcfA (HicA-like mRNA interferase family)
VTKLPSLSFDRILRVLQRDGWVIVRTRGSHIRLHKRTGQELLKVTVPAHRPVKRATLAQVLRQARMDLERFMNLL